MRSEGLDRIFFFQAEDGIRDLVRSRGLGDVYKRQGIFGATGVALGALGAHFLKAKMQAGIITPDQLAAVSYTHLTLPTSDLV